MNALMRKAVLIGLAASLKPATALYAAETFVACNLELGKQIFALCSACHTLNVGDIAREGPSLRGVYGAKVGHDPKFKFSPALLASKLSWDAATLDKFLTNPRRTLPGTMMTFTGLKQPEERAAVACFLRAQQ